jgi:signal peptidase I
MRKKAFTGFGVMLLFVLGFAIFFFLNFKTVIVSGPSMQPTYVSGDRLLESKAYWLIGAIREKDIVVIRNEDGPGYIIKRVFRLAGGKVDYKNVPESWSLADGEFIVPQGCVYVLGDNRPVSEDSRKFGPVPVERILGKIVVVQPFWVVRLGIVGGLLAAFLLVFSGITALADTRRRKAAPGE